MPLIDDPQDVELAAGRDIIFSAGGPERARITAAGVPSGVLAGAGIPIDLRSKGAVMDGSTDDSAALNTAFNTAGAYLVPSGKTVALGNTVTLKQDAWLILAPGATVKWTGGSSTNMFTQSTAAGPNIRSGVIAPLGHGAIDLSAATGVTVFDLHSPQFCRFYGLDIGAAVDQTGFVFKIACDATSNGGYGNNKNAVMNYIGHITAGKNGTFLTAAGALTGTQVVTLNTVEHINALNQGVGFISLGPFADNNYFIGTMRCSINQNNAVGLNIFGSADTYFNSFQTLQVDTFAGKTGRIGIQLGAGSSRTQVFGYFNDPAAEGGQIVDNGSLSHYIMGEWQGTGTITSGLAVAQRGIAYLTEVQSITYAATMASDWSQVADHGMFTIIPTDTNPMTVSNPTNVGKGQMVTYDFLNSSGGTMGTITWGGNFHLAGAFVNPASTKRRNITFYSPDGTYLEEFTRATADI